MPNPLNSTVLFDLPQSQIASLILDRISNSIETSIITGFATPGGLAAIAEPIKARPEILQALVIGAATYPGFEALDELVAAGVPLDRLHVHLGHTSESRAKKNPFVRFHPMLHSKVYYMDLLDSKACAFVGSHNVTSFALTGLNGEAAVMLEGPSDSPEFQKIREHIDAARAQAVSYSPEMKEGYAWWMREYLEGLRAEVKLPQDWQTVRTILLFARAANADRPKTGDELYFEIPEGIAIESLTTETHLFLFDALPSNPSQALNIAGSADAKYKCKTLGAENAQGNRELRAHWRIDGTRNPVLACVEGGIFRPTTPSDMQQVRARVEAPTVEPFEYLFERVSAEWDPEFSDTGALVPMSDKNALIPVTDHKELTIVLEEARGGSYRVPRWKLVNGLRRRDPSGDTRDDRALKLAAPESGSFILVSVRRRRKDRIRHQEKDR